MFVRITVLFTLVFLAISGLVPGVLADDVSAADVSSANNDKRIPDSVVYLDQSQSSLVFVEKALQKLHLYKKVDGFLKRVDSFDCSTGEVQGRKEADGDKKTPEGIYFFKKQFSEKYLAPIYGSGAFTMDYPNILDVLTKKTGSAIWLHGTNKELKSYDSNGCVAVENQNLNYLSDFLELEKTPVIITDRMTFKSEFSYNDRKQKILKLIDRLKKIINRGTYKDYIELYDIKFAPDIYWWNEWMSMRDEKDTHLKIGVEFDSINIYNHDSIYIVTYNQHVKTNYKTSFAGVQKLYLAETNGKIKILCEELLSPPAKFQPLKYDNPIVATGVILKSETIQANLENLRENEIISQVDFWLNAWESSDFIAYGDCYSSDFKSRGMDKTSWIKRKKYLSSMYDYIKINKRDLELSKTDERAVIVFTQDYKSNNYSETGKKKLYLKLEGGEWKIYKESWKKS